MKLAEKIDHTLLKPEADEHQVRRHVDEAIEHGFAAVCVNGHHVAAVAKALAGSPVKTCAVVGFPLGANTTAIKAAEAAAAVDDAAAEIDFVAHLPFLLNRNGAAAAAEFSRVVTAARSVNPAVVIKVIIESALLLQDEKLGQPRIETACRVAQDSGCDFVKTSTGFHPAGGASVQAVSMMKRYCGRLGVKASGGIRCYDDAIKMIDAGADRIGCSASVAIVAANPDRTVPNL